MSYLLPCSHVTDPDSHGLVSLFLPICDPRRTYNIISHLLRDLLHSRLSTRTACLHYGSPTSVLPKALYLNASLQFHDLAARIPLPFAQNGRFELSLTAAMRRRSVGVRRLTASTDDDDDFMRKTIYNRVDQSASRLLRNSELRPDRVFTVLLCAFDRIPNND